MYICPSDFIRGCALHKCLFEKASHQLLNGIESLANARERFFRVLAKNNRGVPRGIRHLIASTHGHMMSAACFELLNRMPKEDFKIVKKHFSFQYKLSEIKEIFCLNIAAHIVGTSSNSYKLHRMLFDNITDETPGLLLCRDWMSMTCPPSDYRLSLLCTLRSFSAGETFFHIFPNQLPTRLLFRKYRECDGDISLESIVHKLRRSEIKLQAHTVTSISSSLGSLPLGHKKVSVEFLENFSKKGGVKAINSSIFEKDRSQSIEFLRLRDAESLLWSISAQNKKRADRDLKVFSQFKDRLNVFERQ